MNRKLENNIVYKLPEGQKEPQVCIHKTSNVKGPMPTNRWWSSLAWEPFSYPVYAHPLTFKESMEGLEIGYPHVRVELSEKDSKKEIYAVHECDFVIGGRSFSAEEARVDDFGDWNVHLLMEGGGLGIRYSIGHGQPFVFTEFRGTNPVIRFAKQPELWIKDGSAIGITVNKRVYAFYAPEGSDWHMEGSKEWECLLPEGKNYFTAAVLPLADRNVFSHYGRYAFSFIADTRVRWQYDAVKSEVTTWFDITAESRDGRETGTITALYPHQWKNTGNDLLAYEYDSPRGTMKCVEGTGFAVMQRYNGVLPFLPLLEGQDIDTLNELLREAVRDEENKKSEFNEQNMDTYFTGKSISRLVHTLLLADRLGSNDAKNRILEILKSLLEDWFTASEGKTENLFYYNENWNTLIGYKSGFGSDVSLNDHHFHYGYYIFGSAILALYDKEWVNTAGWYSMVEELIGDIANPERESTRYPFLRCFDTFAGHSWASGDGKYPWGNNQESSSEAINAWYAVILWGEATGNTMLRDLGIYLYSTEVSAVKNYWFDTDRDNYPKEYNHETVGIVWGGKGTYTTWWTTAPEGIHGINFLPITGGSLYLGHDKEYIKRNYRDMMNSKQGKPEDSMEDVIWSFLVFAEPEEAIKKLNETAYEIEYNETRAYAYYWINTISALGDVNTSVTADIPLFAVFHKSGLTTYIAYNAGEVSRRVRFSDGIEMDVAGNNFGVLEKRPPVLHD